MTTGYGRPDDDDDDDDIIYSDVRDRVYVHYCEQRPGTNYTEYITNELPKSFVLIPRPPCVVFVFSERNL